MRAMRCVITKVLYKRMINMCMFIGGSFLPERVGAEQIVTI